MTIVNPLFDYGNALGIEKAREAYSNSEKKCVEEFRARSMEYVSGYADAVREHKELYFLERLTFIFGGTFSKFEASIKVDKLDD